MEIHYYGSKASWQAIAEVVNKPSGGTERRVPNGVGVFSNAPQGELTYIKVVPDEKNMFVNIQKIYYKRIWPVL